MFTVGSICRVKRFTTEWRNSLKDVRKSQMMPEQGTSYASGFDALVKR
jgi:hypothetical protein